jgi:glutamate-1-semialdehyde 2,1-aminomutase
LNYTDADFAVVADRFLTACRAMERNGWWWTAPATTNRAIKRRILREMLTRRRTGALRAGQSSASRA